MNELDIEILEEEILDLKSEIKQQYEKIIFLEENIEEMNDDLDTICRLAKDAQK